jgi:hypothetical protein
MMKKSELTNFYFMGNYRDIEIDFIKRTLALISQYEIGLHKYKFSEQYNYTLLINCLLGLIVLPKEKTIDCLPKNTLMDMKFRNEMGIFKTVFHADIKDLKNLIIALRHCVAHFNISVESMNADFHIDLIIFKDSKKGKNYIVAKFQANELLPFIRYYSGWLLINLKNRKNRLVT